MKLALIVFTLMFDCIKDAVGRYAIMRLALIFYSYIWPYQKSSSPLCRYEISPHFFTLIFAYIEEAASRYAAMRLALIFFTPSSDCIKDPACRCAAIICHHIFYAGLGYLKYHKSAVARFARNNINVAQYRNFNR